MSVQSTHVKMEEPVMYVALYMYGRSMYSALSFSSTEHIWGLYMWLCPWVHWLQVWWRSGRVSVRPMSKWSCLLCKYIAHYWLPGWPQNFTTLHLSGSGEWLWLSLCGWIHWQKLSDRHQWVRLLSMFQWRTLRGIQPSPYSHCTNVRVASPGWYVETMASGSHAKCVW